MGHANGKDIINNARDPDCDRAPKRVQSSVLYTGASAQDPRSVHREQH